KSMSPQQRAGLKSGYHRGWGRRRLEGLTEASDGQPVWSGRTACANTRRRVPWRVRRRICDAECEIIARSESAQSVSEGQHMQWTAAANKAADEARVRTSAELFDAAIALAKQSATIGHSDRMDLLPSSARLSTRGSTRPASHGSSARSARRTLPQMA